MQSAFYQKKEEEVNVNTCQIWQGDVWIKLRIDNSILTTPSYTQCPDAFNVTK